MQRVNNHNARKGDARALDPRLSLRDIGHSFVPGTYLFRHLTVDFAAGEVWGLKGPSGSGKSTLLSIVAGWEAPREGSVARIGINTTRWVFQNPLGVAQRSVMDHVALPFLAVGLGRQEAEHRAADILGAFGLEDSADKRFSLLSGGEAQRLMLARAAAGKPDLILVDEPTAQLDRATAATVNGVLGALAASGAVVVVASHDLETLEACKAVLDLQEFAGTNNESHVINPVGRL
ncbi:ATP-binding cassette domain-containing protein [Arthrobacter sp. M4]|uniref:ATP-binding cassette domain-containing protein n=1 Tax=Arthrobacter sp. M4 TaxID=218160 RepID=UPI001CDD588D|nr:ATP-binding cassette domain-containing protein [Arthrobacter sp. M4]MCA4131280.1 ATP-binding cassette domain-containing protein [Arthrobacter sp. M4]